MDGAKSGTSELEVSGECGVGCGSGVVVVEEREGGRSIEWKSGGFSCRVECISSASSGSHRNNRLSEPSDETRHRPQQRPQV